MATNPNVNCPSCQEENTRTRVGKTPSYCSFCRFPLSLLAGKYKIEKALSEGGFGIVYLAHHVHLEHDTERVVKVLKSEVFKQEAHMHRRFRREVQVTSALSQRNQHIVRIYDDFGEDPNLGHYYVMEFLRGRPLEDIMPLGKGLDDRITFKIFGEVCMAMAAAHEEEIIHRDLKPDNIFLEKRRNDPYFVKVLDFGIAKPLKGSGGADANMTQGAMGTPAYMAPEQCLNETISRQTDIYAMGIILYELMTGRNPFNLDLSNVSRAAIKLIQAHLVQDATPLSHWRADVPKGVEEAVMKAMAKRPRDRHRSVEAFWNALRAHAPLKWNLTPLFEEYPSLPSLPEASAEPSPSEEETGTVEPAFDREALALAATRAPGSLDDLPSLPSKKSPQGSSAKSTRQLAGRNPLPTSQPDVPTPPEFVAPPPAKDDEDPRPAPISAAPIPAVPSAPKSGLSSVLLGLLGGLLVILVAALLFVIFYKGDKGPTKPQAPRSITKAPTKRAGTTPRAPAPRRAGSSPVDVRTRPSVRPDARPRSRPAARVSARPRPRRKLVRRPVPRRAAPRRLRTGPCGTQPKGLRWVVSRLRKPAKGRPTIKFPGCASCRLKRRGRYLCLGVPRRKKRVKVRIVMEGQVSCAYWLTSKHKRIGWYLKYEDLDSMADEAYNCVKSMR